MPQPSRRVLWAVAAAGAALLVAAVIGTSAASRSGPDERADRATPTSSPVPVVVPGRPGESASTVMSDEIEAPDGSVYNLLDATFMRMMIPHHAQGLEIAVLAPGRASHPQVLAIAERIKAAQLPEIAVMRAWLNARGLSEEDRSGHDHATMAGMQKLEAIQALKASTGDAFDRTFVEMMTAHHQGAVKMATDVLAVCRNGQVEELATAIASEQAAEIHRLREALAAPR
jgi:uncharacterized protein (DUF305 family)